MMRLVLAAALLAAACSKGDSGPPCDKVVDHMMELTKQMMPGHDPESLGNRQQMIDQCKQRKLTGAERKCLVDAKTFNDLGACSKAKKSAAPAPAAPEPPAPTPAGSAAPGSGS